jgi:tetratricopeptide (TPR) repeat protein
VKKPPKAEESRADRLSGATTTALRVNFLPLEMLFRPHSKIFNYIKKEGCFVQRPIHALQRESSTMLRKAFSRLELVFLLVFSTSILFVGTGTIAVAQEDEILDRLYGSGVHAYKRGDYKRAHELFSIAIETGNRDPRTLYFRGLTYLKLGRPEQADQDFYRAAEQEVADGNVTLLVDQSLIRVQGPDRYRLESARTDVLRERHLRNKRMNQERHAVPEQIRPGLPRNTEPAESTSAKDANDDLLNTDEETADKNQTGKSDRDNEEDELFSTDDAESDKPTEKAPAEDFENKTPDPFDDIFDADTEEETEKKPANDAENDDAIFGE